MNDNQGQCFGRPQDAESVRLAVLDAHDTLGLTDDPRLTAIAELAAAICTVPVGLVTTIDADHQHFLGRTGTELTGNRRDLSFCTHAIVQQDIMVVEDATRDPCFADNPLVTDLHVRFYAGVPLVADGAAIGTLCVLGFDARGPLSALEHQALATLAQNVLTLIVARRAEADRKRAADRFRDERDDQAQRFRVLADTMPQMVWSAGADGRHDYYNARWFEFTGMEAGSGDGDEWNAMFHPEDRDRAWEAWQNSVASGEPYEIEYRLRNHAGAYRWVLGRALPMHDETRAVTRWFGTCTDIHDQKLASDQREIVAQELSHRIKNIFSVIAGLIGYSVREYPQFSAVADGLRDRVMALGRAHDFVRPHSETSQPMGSQTSLQGLLVELLAPYQSGDGGRLVILGDDAEIDDQSATPLALLFHELATNAAKYGALSTSRGVVTLAIAQAGDEIAIDWTESGGPPCMVPERSGFGSRLIELSLDRQLGGRVARHWRPEGLTLNVRIPVSAMRRPRTA